jgi:hypothetical protein
MKDIRSFARIGAVGLFIDIANGHYKNYKDAARIYTVHYDEMNKYSRNNDICWIEDPFVDEKYFELYSECHKYKDIIELASVQAIVFYSVFLESLIYDYGCIYLGDSYVRSHLDRLDFVSKWIVVPKIVTGIDIDKSKPFFCCLKALHRERNNIIHHKTKELNLQIAKDSNDMLKSLMDSTENAKKCAKLAIKALDEISPEIFLATRFEIA